MKALSFRLAWLTALAVAMSAPVAAAAPPPTGKTVLTIYSQAREAVAIGPFDQSLRDTLGDASGDHVTCYAEFLDAQRFSGDRHIQLFRDYLSHKYEGRQIDALVLAGRPAADAVRREPSLFRGVPTVFYTIDRADQTVPADGFGLVGTFGRDQQRSLELALALHPDTQQVFVVVQTPPEGPPFEHYVRSQLAQLESRVAIRYLSNMRTADVIGALAAAPPRSVVLYVRQVESAGGGRSDPRDVLTLLERSTSLPIYGGLDSYIGHGVVGGYLYSGGANGAAAGALAWRLANGERPRSTAESKPPAAVFDWRQLRRFNIQESRLPLGSVILFRDQTFWERYRRYAIGALSIFVVQLSLIGTLLVQLNQRRRAQRALRDSEDRYRLTVEAQTDLVCRFLPDSTLTFVNDAYCRFQKKTAAELIGKRMLDLMPPAARESVACHIAALIESPGASRYEHRVMLADGQIGCWLEWVNATLVGPDGRVVELLGTGRDITDRKRAEDALQHSEARNAAILRAMPDLMFVMSRDGVYLDYHAKDPRDLFVPPEQFIGKSMFDIMPPALSIRFAEAIARADASGEPVVVEYSLPMQQGERFFETRIVGSVNGQVLSIVREITEQRGAAERLRSSEDRYALATSAGGVGVWDWNVETDRVYVDPVVLSILGHPDAGRAGVRVDWRELVHPEDRDIALAASTAYVEGRADRYDVELRMLHHDGGIRWFHTVGSVVRRADGTIYRMIGTFTDVTDRKRADDALLDREATLRASYGQIQDLAGRLIVAQETERKRLARELHDDLSQRVSLMAIEVDQLQQTAPDYADRVRRIADYAAGVASSVHQISHRLHPFKLEALGLVSAVASVCVEISALHRLAVEFRHDQIPARLSPEVTLCLFRIVQEGLQNIAQHSHAQSASVSLSGAMGGLELTITDSGVGFDAAVKGNGLGLVSIRERVHFLGGQLTIHSASGVGTRLDVRVPFGLGTVSPESEHTGRLRQTESAYSRRLSENA
jgi:PAS domain S-box-containing protein